jgi:hypothetical protein
MSSLKDDSHNKGMSAEMPAEMHTALEKVKRSMEDWGDSTRRIKAGTDEVNRLLDNMKRGQKTTEVMLENIRDDVDHFEALMEEHALILALPPTTGALSPQGHGESPSSSAHNARAVESIPGRTDVIEEIDSSSTALGSTSHSDEHFSGTVAGHSNHSSASNDFKSSEVLSQSPSLPSKLTTSPPLPITDLVTDIPTTTPLTLDLTGLQTSKHHPDFRIRNQPKMLRLATILSNLHLHLSVAHRNEDQETFNALHARITAAGEGLGSLAVSVPAEKKDGARRLSGGELSEVEKTKLKKDREWYGVQHGSAVEEGGEHNSLSLGRVERAKAAYEAKLNRSVGEVDAKSDGKVEAEREGEWQGESEETTLVDGVEELTLLYSTISAAAALD